MKRFTSFKDAGGVSVKLLVVVALVVGAVWTFAAPGRPGPADPGGNLSFRLEVEGQIVGGFKSLSGMDSETEVIEFRSGSEPDVDRLLPGKTRYNITLKRGLVPGDLLWAWRQKIANGEADARDGAVVAVDYRGQPVARYTFSNAWPKSWKAIEANDGRGTVVIEEIVFTAERIELAE